MSAPNLISINVSLLRHCLSNPELERLNNEIIAFRNQPIPDENKTSGGKKERKRTFNAAIEQLFQNKITEKEITISLGDTNSAFKSEDLFIEVDRSSDIIEKYNLMKFVKQKEFDKKICLIHDHKRYFFQSQEFAGEEFVNGTEIAAVLQMKGDQISKKLTTHFPPNNKKKKKKFSVTVSDVLINVDALHIFKMIPNPDKIVVLNDEKFTIANRNDFTNGHVSFPISVCDEERTVNILKRIGMEQVNEIQDIVEKTQISEEKVIYLSTQNVLPLQTKTTLFASSMLPAIHQNQSFPQQSQFIPPPSSQFIPPQQSQFIPPQPSQFIAPSQF